MPKRKLNYQPLTLWNMPEGPRYFGGGDGGLYSYMFIQDVMNHLTPYHVHSSRDNKSFKIDISNPSVEMEIRALFHMPYEYESYYQPLSETIFSFIRSASSYLLARGGKVYFEIVDATIEDKEILRPVFALYPIHGKVIEFIRTYYQIIPKDTQDSEKKFIAIPKSKVWILEIAKDLGKVNDIITLSNNLKELEKASLLGSDIVLSQKNLFGFDFGKTQTLIDAKILEATSKWGWDMRMGLNNQHALEYYLYHRMLRFGYSMATLRTDMLFKMNGLLKRLGYDATISFSGIPTPEEYLNAIQMMEQRQFSFKQASDLIYFSL